MIINQKNIYLTAIYNFDGILHSNFLYPVLYKKCFRCIKTFPKHNVKFSIRKNLILEKIKINVLVYFLIIYFFLNDSSTNKTHINIKNFKEIIDVDKISLKNIQKFFRILRTYIKKVTHKKRLSDPLGIEFSTRDVAIKEID